MPCSFISRCKGDVWWLEKKSVKSERQHYPKMIKVGKIGHEKVYLPVETCHNISQDPNWTMCDHCGAFSQVSGVTIGSIFPVRVCPNCGRKVVD